MKTKLPFARRRVALGAALLFVVVAGAACGAGQAPAAAPAADTPAAAPAADTPPATEAAAAPEQAASGDAGARVPAERAGMYSAAPEMTIDPTKYYYATLATDKGDIKVQLFADRAPTTVNNFVYLAREGFYDGTTFHRVLEDFMAQGGDPTGTGAGGPGYQFADEFYPGASFDRPGLLAMANSGPGTNGSQFFITFAPTTWLNGLHTIFGEVVEGQEVLDQITRRDPDQSPGTPGDTIQSVTIEESDSSLLPTPTALPPTPTPFPPTNAQGERPLAEVPAAEKANYFNAEPAMVIDTAKTYTATIQTSAGEMVMALYDDEAPTAVNNFVVLANVGFYDNLPVNDVNPGQVVVIGAPDGDPQHDVGYTIKPEVGISTTVEAGSVTYNSQRADTDGRIIASGSQLLVAIAPPPADSAASYSFFGKIVEGQDVLTSLTVSDTVQSITVQQSQ